MAEREKALVRGLLEGVDKSDISTLDRHFDPKYNDHNPPPFPSLAPGLAGARQAFKIAVDVFKDFLHTVEDQVTEGNKVASRIRGTGTHCGEFLGIPPTNKQVSMSGIAIHRTGEGKLAEHWATVDAWGLLQQLGVAPAPTGPGAPGLFPERRTPPGAGAAGRSTPEANKALIRRFLEEHDRQKGPPAELCTSAYTSYVPGAPPMNLKGDKEMSGIFYAAFPDLKHRVEDVLAEGEKVAFRMTLAGTHKHDLMAVPATGKPISIQAMGIARIAGNKVDEVWFVFDQLMMMVQLGVVPPPGA